MGHTTLRRRNDLFLSRCWLTGADGERRKQIRPFTTPLRTLRGGVVDFLGEHDILQQKPEEVAVCASTEACGSMP